MDETWIADVVRFWHGLNWDQWWKADPSPDDEVGICGKGGQSVPAGVGQSTLLVDGLTVGGTSAA